MKVLFTANFTFYFFFFFTSFSLETLLKRETNEPSKYLHSMSVYRVSIDETFGQNVLP